MNDVVFEEKDYEFAIECAACLKTYVSNISKLLEKSSTDLDESINHVHKVLIDAKKRIFLL